MSAQAQETSEEKIPGCIPDYFKDCPPVSRMRVQVEYYADMTEQERMDELKKAVDAMITGRHLKQGALIVFSDVASWG